MCEISYILGILPPCYSEKGHVEYANSKKLHIQSKKMKILLDS